MRRTRLGLAGVLLASMAVIGAATLPAAAADRVTADATVRDAQSITFPYPAASAGLSVATSVDCPADGECVAGGSVVSSADPNSEVPFIVVQHEGTWGTAQVLEFPSGAIAPGSSHVVSVIGVECPAVGECEVVGIVEVLGGTASAWRSRVSAGTAATPQLLGFAPTAPVVVDHTYPSGLSCAAVGECLIVGVVEAHDSQVGTIWMPVQWSITAGVVSAGAEIPLPASVRAPSIYSLASVSSVSCPAVGDCVVTGGSDRSQSDPVTWVRVQRGGVWGDASVVTLPAGLVVTDPTAAMFVGSQIDCWSVGECMVLGGFQSAARHRGIAPFTAQLVSGVVQVGTALALPSSFAGDEGVWGASLECSGPGACLVVADIDRPSLGLSAIAHFESTDGIWGQGEALPAVAGVTAAFAQGGSCRSPGNCVLNAIGSAGSYVVVESARTWSAPVSLNPVQGARSATYALVFDVACVHDGSTCVMTGQASDQGVIPTAMPAGAPGTRSIVPNALSRSRSVMAVGASPQATTVPPWAFVQSIDWTPPPAPEPEPLTPKYTG